MEKELLFEDGNLRLEYVADGNYIHETWWGFTSDTVFGKLLNTIMEFLEQKSVDGIILDAREHKGLSPASQDLAAKKIGLYAKKHGILKQAIIIPKDIFSKFSVDNYSKKFDSNDPAPIKYFDSIESAQNWLKEK